MSWYKHRSNQTCRVIMKYGRKNWTSERCMPNKVRSAKEHIIQTQTGMQKLQTY